MTLSADVTRRKLVLGARDSVTGWYEKSYEDSTVEMIVLSRGSTYLHLAPGAFVREDAVGICVDPVAVGDLIKIGADKYYEVLSIEEHWLLGSFIRRDCQLHEMPFYEE